MANPRRINLDEQAKVGSLTSDIIADGAIIASKIAPGAIDSNALGANSVSASKLAADVFGAGVVPNGATNAIDVNVDDVTLEIVTDVVRVKAITQANFNITDNLDFNNNQALEFILENVSSDPAAGNQGRLIWRTDLLQVKVDDGTNFVTLAGGGGGHIIQDEGTPLTQRAVLNFQGPGVTAIDFGGDTVVTIPGGGSSSFDKTLVTVSNIITDKIINLANTPVANSEFVAWNGLLLRPGASNDYTITGSTVTLNAGITLTIGDEILVVYAF